MKQIVLACVMVVAATPVLAACPVQAPPGLVTPGTLTIGTMLTNPPQTFIEAGQPTGFDIDMSRAIAEKMCLKAEFVNVNFAGLFPGLMAHKFDYVSSGLGITPQRRETFDFVPYFRGGIQFVGRKENHFFFQNEDGLCGLRVATIAGTTQASALERANRGVCKQKPINLKYFPSFNDAAMQLRTKAADIAFVDWAFASYISRLMPELALASPIISGRPEVPRNLMGLAFRKDEKAQEAAVTQAIQALEKSGEYDQALGQMASTRGGCSQSGRRQAESRAPESLLCYRLRPQGVLRHAVFHSILPARAHHPGHHRGGDADRDPVWASAARWRLCRAPRPCVGSCRPIWASFAACRCWCRSCSGTMRFPSSPTMPSTFRRWWPAPWRWA